MKGFVVCVAGLPVAMELSDEIVGGLTVTDPVPVFEDADDAKAAALANQCRYGSDATLQIRQVELTIGAIELEVEYNEDEPDEGDE